MLILSGEGNSKEAMQSLMATWRKIRKKGWTKKIFPKDDLECLFGDNNPVVLHFRVCFVVAIHFVSHGLEFHEQLEINSFIFIQRIIGPCMPNFRIKQNRKWQGGIDKTENPTQQTKRMLCPVRFRLKNLPKRIVWSTILQNQLGVAAMVQC